MASVWRAYLALLHKYPFRVQAATSGTIFFVSDITSQQLVEKKGWRNNDYVRTVRQSAFGFCFAGPSMFGWYKLLGSIYSWKSKFVPLWMMLTDQTVFPPIFLTVYFSTVALTTGHSIDDIPSILKRDIPSTWLTGVKLWPCVQIINFYFVPMHHRVMVVNVVALFWNTYLSWKANAKRNAERTAAQCLDGGK